MADVISPDVKPSSLEVIMANGVICVWEFNASDPENNGRPSWDLNKRDGKAGDRLVAWVYAGTDPNYWSWSSFDRVMLPTDDGGGPLAECFADVERIAGARAYDAALELKRGAAEDLYEACCDVLSSVADGRISGGAQRIARLRRAVAKARGQQLSEGTDAPTTPTESEAL